MLPVIDAGEALGIDAADAAPDHWRHLHNRLVVGEPTPPLQTLTTSPLAAAPGTRAMTRFGFVMIIYAATLSVALTSVFHPAPKLLWNVGASVPFGLRAVRRTLPFHVGKLAVDPPPSLLAVFHRVVTCRSACRR